jgi:hypothetical protein
MHAPSGIRNHSPNKRAAADPRLGARGHCHQLTAGLHYLNERVKNERSVYLKVCAIVKWYLWKILRFHNGMIGKNCLAGFDSV